MHSSRASQSPPTWPAQTMSGQAVSGQTAQSRGVQARIHRSGVRSGLPTWTRSTVNTQPAASASQLSALTQRTASTGSLQTYVRHRR